MSTLKVDSIQSTTPEKSLEINSDVKFVGVLCATTIYVGETTVISSGGTSSNQGYIWLLDSFTNTNNASPSATRFNIQLVSGLTSNTLNPNNILRLKVNDDDTSLTNRTAWWNTLYQNHVNGLLQITYAGNATISSTIQISSMVDEAWGWTINGRVISGPPSGTTFPVSERHYINWSFGPSSGGTGGGGVISGGTIEVTYSELVDKITGSTLTTGVHYTITDYRTCYDQPDYDNQKNEITVGIYKSADTVSAIVVFATSVNTISIDAFQPEFPFDKIKYDYSFDTTEHTSGTAFGRITERIDNFNNRTDYDHRTILFKRYRGYSYNENNPLSGLVGISGITGTTGVLYGNTGTTFNSNISSGSIIAIPNLNPAFFEVISVESDSLAIISGVTISGTDNAPYYSASDDGIMSYYQPNIRQNEVYEYTTFGDALDVSSAINNYIGNQANLYLEDNSGQFLLANNVFLVGSFLNNTIGNGSYNNTFNDDCDSNQIGDRFYNNSTNDDFDGNIIGDFFNNNYITSNFNNNRIGSDFEDNILIGGSFYRNNIGNDFNNNVWTNNDFQNNEIGNQFNYNKIYNDFYNNDIGNGYNNNESYSEFYRNLIGNGYNSNTVYSNFYENNIGHVFEDNNIGTNLTIGTYGFYRNIIGSGFEDNEITNDFYGNEIGIGFFNNDISGETYTNRIGEQFENNTIYGDFYDNQIFNEFKGNMTYQDFNANKVDWGFGSNQFSGSCGGNVFGPAISSNDFLGLVFGNVIKGDFEGNTIGDVFGTNNIGGAFINNTIAQNFANNEIGNFFINNTIDEGFGFGGSSTQKNYIGDEFFNNTVGEYFYNNRVGNYFQNNTLGDYFQWNVIDTNINLVDFTSNYGNITTFTYTTLGTGTTDGIYTNLSGTTNGHGVNATFDVEVSGNTVIGVSGNTSGKLYHTGNTITILGSQIGGVTGVISGFSINKLSVKIYKPADSTYEFPSNETEMDYLIDNSPLFDTYYSNNIQGVSYSTQTGVDQQNYGMVIDGYIQIPSSSTYYFGLSSDDGSDAFINGVKVADWYGQHGDNVNLPGGNQYPISLTAGTYSVKVRLQERSGGDIVSLLYSSNSGSTWNIIPDNWFVSSTGVTGSYPNISVTGGTGENATFDVTVSGGVVNNIQLNNVGGSYSVGNILTIDGSVFGGTDDITITVDSVYSDDVIVTVTDVNPNPSVYEHYTCHIFERQGGDKRLSYYDSNDILTITDINT